MRRASSGASTSCVWEAGGANEPSVPPRKISSRPGRTEEQRREARLQQQRRRAARLGRRLVERHRQRPNFLRRRLEKLRALRVAAQRASVERAASRAPIRCWLARPCGLAAAQRGSPTQAQRPRFLHPRERERGADHLAAALERGAVDDEWLGGARAIRRGRGGDRSRPRRAVRRGDAAAGPRSAAKAASAIGRRRRRERRPSTAPPSVDGGHGGITSAALPSAAASAATAAVGGDGGSGGGGGGDGGSGGGDRPAPTSDTLDTKSAGTCPTIHS